MTDTNPDNAIPFEDVDIDRDGASVWVADRCGANPDTPPGESPFQYDSCAGSKLPPVLKFALRRSTTTCPAAGTLSGVSPCSASISRPISSSLSLLSDVE